MTIVLLIAEIGVETAKEAIFVIKDLVVIKVLAVGTGAIGLKLIKEVLF